MSVSRMAKIRFVFAAAFVVVTGLSAIGVPSKLSAAQQASATEVLLPIDAAQSKVHYVVSSTLHTVHGEFSLKRGDIHFDPESGKAGGQVIVDATTGESGSNARDKRMHKEILESDKYSEVIFVPDRIVGKVVLSGSSSVQIHGTFTLHGTSHELTVPAQVNFSGDRWNSNATFDVPYISWGLKNPSNFLFKVSPTVTIHLELSGTH